MSAHRWKTERARTTSAHRQSFIDCGARRPVTAADASDSRKAKADGEDLVTPLVERMAGVVVDAVGRQR